MEINPWNEQVGLGFMFTNVSGPFDTSDFANEPSFIGLTVMGTYSPDDSRTGIVINLNTSEIVSISQGRLIADILKTEIEDFFDIILPFSSNFTFGDTVSYFYVINECPVIQKFRNVFLVFPKTNFVSYFMHCAS